MFSLSIFLLAALVGIVPMTFYAVIITWLDRYEREPKLLLISTFLWGLFVASVAAIILNTIFNISIYELTMDTALSYDLTAVFFGPVVEEFVKGMAILLLFIYFKKDFNTLLDGVIYGGLVGIGFAAAENTIYIYNGYAGAGALGFFAVALLRTIFLPFLHAIFSAIIGLGFAAARIYKRKWTFSPILCYLIAVFLHASHNLIAVSQVLPLQLIGFAFEWIGAFIMLSGILYLINRERKIMKDYLLEEVRLGNMTDEQYNTAISPYKRTLSFWTLPLNQQRKKIWRYYDLAATLAFTKYNQKQSGENDNTTAKDIEETRKKMKELSIQI